MLRYSLDEVKAPETYSFYSILWKPNFDFFINPVKAKIEAKIGGHILKGQDRKVLTAQELGNTDPFKALHQNEPFIMKTDIGEDLLKYLNRDSTTVEFNLPNMPTIVNFIPVLDDEGHQMKSSVNPNMLAFEPVPVLKNMHMIDFFDWIKSVLHPPFRDNQFELVSDMAGGNTRIMRTKDVNAINYTIQRGLDDGKDPRNLKIGNNPIRPVIARNCKVYHNFVYETCFHTAAKNKYLDELFTIFLPYDFSLKLIRDNNIKERIFIEKLEASAAYAMVTRMSLKPEDRVKYPAPHRYYIYTKERDEYYQLQDLSIDKPFPVEYLEMDPKTGHLDDYKELRECKAEITDFQNDMVQIATEDLELNHILSDSEIERYSTDVKDPTPQYNGMFDSFKNNISKLTRLSFSNKEDKISKLPKKEEEDKISKLPKKEKDEDASKDKDVS